MHATIANELGWFVFRHGLESPKKRIAELGSLRLNDQHWDGEIPVTGFDIVAGENVDVVIEPGRIPAEYVGEYDAVIAANSFQFCPDPRLFIAELMGLAKQGAPVFVNMCGPRCLTLHTTSENAYGWKDELRLAPEMFRALFRRYFQELRFTEYGTGHGEMIWEGVRR